MSLHKHPCTPPEQFKHVKAAAQDAGEGGKKKHETRYSPENIEASSFPAASGHQVRFRCAKFCQLVVDWEHIETAETRETPCCSGEIGVKGKNRIPVN